MILWERFEALSLNLVEFTATVMGKVMTADGSKRTKGTIVY